MFAKREDMKAAANFGASAQRASFWARLFVLYIPAWILLLVFLLVIANGTDNEFLFGDWVIDIFGGDSAHFGGMMVTLYYALIASIIPIYLEKRNRKWRRKNGLPLNKNIEREYQRLLIEEQLKLEEEARKNLGIDGGVDKSDIRYWHSLLQDGIITQAEFDAKKAELLS